MIRQLPAGFALVIRGGCAPVIARLPRAWNNPAYRRARRRGPARPGPARQIRRAAEPGPDIPDDPTATWPSGCWCLVPVGPAMTADPLTAVLDQLAAYREQLTQLDDREAAHFAAVGEQLAQLAGLITTMGRTLADDTAALARLEALDRQVTELAARLAGPGADGKDRSPARPGTSLVDSSPPPNGKQPIAELRAWVEQVYRPGYGHLAATLGPCWAAARPVPVRAGHRQPAVDGALPPARPQHQPAVRPGRIPGPHPARPRRPADDRNHRLRPRRPAPAGYTWSMP